MKRQMNTSNSVIWKVMVLTALFTFHCSLFTAHAQKFALVDMEYILTILSAFPLRKEVSLIAKMTDNRT